MGPVEAKGVGSGDDLPEFCLYLPEICLSSVVGVEVEEVIKVFDLFEVEGAVISDYWLCYCFLPFFGEDGLAVDAHRYIDSNII